LKEYRRDIKRFLRKEREAYPAMPQGYFDAATAKLLATFREGVVKNPREELLAKFPEAAVAGTLQATWQTSAASVYRNWLQYLLSKKTDASTLSAMTPAVRN
jgi:homoserine O-succinyltransferase